MAARKKKPAPKAKAKPAPKRATSHARAKAPKAKKTAPPTVVFTDAPESGQHFDAKWRKTERIAKLRADALANAVAEDAEPAPAPPGPESDTEERVAHCFLLMSRLQWRNYETRAELAVAWGVKDTTIRDYAAEASRRLRTAPEDLEAAKLVHAKLCEDVQKRARTTFNEQTGMPDFGAELKAIELTARFLGIEESKTTKVELTGKDGGPIETKTPTIFIPQEIEGE